MCFGSLNAHPTNDTSLEPLSTKAVNRFLYNYKAAVDNRFCKNVHVYINAEGFTSE